MSLLEPGALAWLALLPVLVLLWLMKLRRREARVSAGFLWEQAAREARVDSFSRRLQANLLLLLQLLAAILLALAMARPYLEVASASAPEVAVLVDTSASMGARRNGSTRFEEARAQARRLLASAPANAQVLLGSYDGTARVLAPFSRDRSEAMRALERLAPRDVAGDARAGRALAASILASRPRAEAFLVGDRPPAAPVPDRLRFVDCGGPAANLAFFALRAARSREGSFTLVAGLRNHGSEPEQRELEIRRGGVLVAARRVGLSPGARESVRFRLPAEGDPVVEARLAGTDALAVDDRAWTILPEERSRVARVVGSGNLFAEQALAAVPGLSLERGPDAGGAALVLWEGEPPWPLPAGVHFLLKPPSALRQGSPLAGPFLLVPEEVAEAPLADVAVAEVQPLRLPPGSQVLARAGGEPALALVRSGPATALVFAFDLYRSDLPLSPALPLLFAEVVEKELGAGAGPVEPEGVPGQPLRIRASEPVQVHLPTGETVELEPEEGHAVLSETGRVGLYRIQLGGEQWPVAVSLLSDEESDLSPGEAPPPGTGPGPGAPPAASRGVAELWPWVAAGSLLLLLAEWFLYHRRRS